MKIDQLTLRVMPDSSTGANALIAGEIDYMQYLPFDMLPSSNRKSRSSFSARGTAPVSKAISA